MMKKLFFILILFSFCVKPFAQNNQYLILGNDEVPKKTKTKKVVKPTEQKPAENNAGETTGENYTPTKSIDVGAGGIFTSLNFFKNTRKLFLLS